jgi:hypothetical protein
MNNFRIQVFNKTHVVTKKIEMLTVTELHVKCTRQMTGNIYPPPFPSSLVYGQCLE